MEEGVDEWCRVGGVNIKSLWERFRSRFLWVTPNDLERIVGKRMAGNTKTLDDVLAEVQAEKTVVDSAVVLIGGLSDQLKAAGGDPAKIQAVIDAIDANKAELAAAVQAGTPAAPAA